MAKLTGKVTKITPAMATKWLEGNVHNRKITQKYVADYGKQMKEGLWRLNGATIAFDTNDCLVDGQHRLWACIESNTPFSSLVVFGLAPDVFSTVDSGRKRSAGDAIHVSGLATKAETTIAATANLVIRYQNGGVYARTAIPAQVTLEFVKGNPEIINWVMSIVGKGGWTRAYATSLAAIGFLAARKYRVKAGEFVEAFVTGENLAQGSPILALRNRLATEKNMKIEDRAALTALAWNAFIEGRTMTRSALPKRDTFPVIKGA